MDTDSLYLALAEENLDNCILLEKKAQQKNIRRIDCRDDFIAHSKNIYFPRTCCAVHNNHDKKNFRSKVLVFFGCFRPNFRSEVLFFLLISDKSNK